MVCKSKARSLNSIPLRATQPTNTARLNHSSRPLPRRLQQQSARNRSKQGKDCSESNRSVRGPFRRFLERPVHDEVLLVQLVAIQPFDRLLRLRKLAELDQSIALRHRTKRQAARPEPINTPHRGDINKSGGRAHLDVSGSSVKVHLQLLDLAVVSEQVVQLVLLIAQAVTASNDGEECMSSRSQSITNVTAAPNAQQLNHSVSREISSTCASSWMPLTKTIQPSTAARSRQQRSEQQLQASELLHF
jgi:hypothetical protein